MTAPEPFEVPPKAERPTHVAIIMDGNGRWATSQGLPRIEGHRKGADVVRDITTYARQLEIPFLTLFSFSVQNWRRPPAEVQGLMQLLEQYCQDERDTLMDNQIRLATIGDLDRLPTATRRAVSELCAETFGNSMMRLTLALDYGGREEILSAAQRLATEVAAGRLRPSDIDERRFHDALFSHDMPDPDLVVRTSGELRLSNFLLWQAAYAELYFTDVHWPDFGRRDFAAALSAFARRTRRFGATDEQVQSRAT